MPLTLGSLSNGLVNPFTLTVARTGQTTGANSASFTITSANISTAAADRILIICVSGRGDAGTPIGSVTSLTVDGNSATKRAERNVYGYSNYPTNSAIFTIPWATGTTANVAYTFSNNRTNVSTAIFAGYGMSSAVPTDISETTYVSGTETKNLAVSAGGRIVGVFTSFITTTTWGGGVTEVFDGTSVSYASGGFSRSQTAPITISNIIGGVPFGGALALASFR